VSEELIVERDGGVVTVWFNRPESLNAFTPEMNVSLRDLLRQLGDDDDVRVLVLTGKGRAFSAGADLKSLGQPGQLERPAEVGYERVRAAGLRIEELMEFPRPTIAAVNGAVAGFACSLAFACDVILAGESARFGFTFSRIGYVPDAGVSYFLPRLVGLPRAKELFFTGDVITAAEADHIGLVNRVVPDPALMETVLALARKIAERPATALRMGKSLLNRAASADFRTAIELEAHAQGILGTTEEHKNAVREFARSRRKD
jgi:2-(1,2-epoxy-1,2-dihydrophenyl)acetyl-CoA isomerase